MHEYLDDATIELASDDTLDINTEGERFRDTFDLIYRSLQEKSFRRWDGSRFAGKFLQSVYEVVATGVAQNLGRFLELVPEEASKVIEQRAKDLWNDEVFRRYSGAGVRGTSRLANLLPMAKDFMAQ